MKTSIKQTILSFFLIAVFAFGTISCAVDDPSGVFLKTSSPNKTYTVELTGNQYVPDVPGIDHEARFNLFKNGQQLVREAHVDRYDWFDSDFAGMYPEHKWVTNSVLRFGHDVAKSNESPDSLSISNKTNKTVKYLKITIKDMLFVFEMPPQSKMRLQVPHQGSSSWVWSEGEFTDGHPLKGNGANFYTKDKLNEPLRYCLSVENEAIRIESPIMDGFFNEGTSEKTNIPQAADCDL